MTRLTDAERLADLQWHWGEVYSISAMYGVWRALPILGSPVDLLQARTADQLRLLIRADYFTHDRKGFRQ